MILVQIPAGVTPCQIEFPVHELNERGRPVMEEVEGKKGKHPKSFGERSGKGSMHLAPGTKTITAPELAFIKKHFPETRLHVLDAKAKSPKEAADEIAAKLKAAKPAEDKPKPKAGSGGGSGRGGSNKPPKDTSASAPA